MLRMGCLFLSLASGCCAPFDIEPEPSEVAPPASAVGPARDAPEPAVAYRTICGAELGTRTRGTSAQARALREQLKDTTTSAAAIPLVCRAGATEAELAVGYYYVGMRLLREERAEAVTAIRAGALVYADPLALLQLARLHFHGEAVTGFPVPRDLGAAHCEAWSAMTISAGLSQREGDQDLHTMVVAGALPLVDSYERADIRAEYDVTAHDAERRACIAGHRARYEARFGALPAATP
jgi:hypothetical protein